MSNASEDLPDPDTPVTTVSRPTGMSTSKPCKLCSRAPTIRITAGADMGGADEPTGKGPPSQARCAAAASSGPSAAIEQECDDEHRREGDPLDWTRGSPNVVGEATLRPATPRPDSDQQTDGRYPEKLSLPPERVGPGPWWHSEGSC